MVGPGTARLRLIGLGLIGLLVLAALTSLAYVPAHRSTVRISDPQDPGLPPEFDAALLEASLEGRTYVVTLSLFGPAQPSGYDVFILGQESGQSLGPHVYRLEFQFGKEENYGVATERDGNRLIVRFPTDLLIDGAYIVGLEAMTATIDGTDYVRERPREELTVQPVLALPFDPSFLLLASTTYAIGLGGLLVYPSLRSRRPDPPP